jgi:hypothetical protein
MDSGAPLDVAVAGAKIGVHQFMAALNDWGLGFSTRAQIVAAFSIVPADEAALDYIAGKWTGKTDVVKYQIRSTLHDVLLVGEANLKYQRQVDFTTRFNAQFP